MRIELLAPHIGLTILLAVAISTVVYVKKSKKAEPSIFLFVVAFTSDTEITFIPVKSFKSVTLRQFRDDVMVMLESFKKLSSGTPRKDGERTKPTVKKEAF